MGKPKLYYFGIRGRGQYLHSLLSYLKIDYEFVLVSGDLDKIKPQCTFGQIPLYVDDDIKMCQTQAIARYISTKNKFYGENLLETAKIDEIVDSFWDTINPIFNALFRLSDQEREAFKKNNKVNTFLQVYEKKLTENKYIAGGNSLTYADLGAFITYDYCDLMGYVDDKKNYPKLEELRNYFKSQPQMQTYLDSIQNLTK